MQMADRVKIRPLLQLSCIADSMFAVSPYFMWSLNEIGWKGSTKAIDLPKERVWYAIKFLIVLLC